MKKNCLLIALILTAPVIVVLSCVSNSIRRDDSQDLVSLNTGVDITGRIMTCQVIDTIESVIVHDGTDRARHIELSDADWQYNPQTTELRILREIPYLNPVYHMEGFSERPQRFVISSITPGESPVVFIQGRLAIESIDYSWYPEKTLIVFIKHIDIDQPGFFIDYSSPSGGGCFGTRGEEAIADSIEHYLSQIRREKFRKELEKDEEQPFLAKGSGSEPVIIMRALTVEEKEAQLNLITAVIKPRHSTDREISKEVGFDSRLPGKIPLPEHSAFALAGVRMIVETAAPPGTITSVRCYYQFSDKTYASGGDSIQISLSNTPPADSDSDEFVIESGTLTALPSFTKTISWGITQNGDGYSPVKTVSWRGTSHGVYIETECLLDESVCQRVETILSAILDYRS